MVFAAGLGTRLRPLTDSLPKALVPVAGKPLLWHVLGRLRSAGFGEVVVNVHHFGDQIIGYLRDNPDFADLEIRISDEREALLDTGGGLLKARPLLEGGENGRFLVHNVDIFSNADLEALWTDVRPDAVATLVVSERPTSRYLLFDGDMRLCGWTNVATGEVRSPYGRDLDLSSCRRFAFAGMHVLSDRLFPLFGDYGFDGAFPVMDFYLRICADHPVYGVAPEGMSLLDVGKTASLPEAERFLAAGN